MTRNGHQIRVQVGDRARHHSESLHGIRVENDTGLAGDLADLSDIVDRSEFVIDIHNGDDCGRRTNGLFHIGWVDSAVGTHGEYCHIVSVTLAPMCRIQNGLVLGGHRDEMRLFRFAVFEDTENGQIVGLCATGCENNLLGSAIQAFGYLTACLFEAHTRSAPDFVNTGGVAPIPLHDIRHCGDDRWIGLGCPAVVQIDVF